MLTGTKFQKDIKKDMRYTYKIFSSIALVITLVFTTYCQKKNESNISSKGDTESHNMGKNCMDCHEKGGKGEGWFTIAGTVYDTIFLNNNPNPNGTVFLYTDKNGTGSLIATVDVDGNGNFYTTEAIDFGSGLYPKIVNEEGKSKIMSFSVPHGACNRCHNISTHKIYIK